MTDALSKLLAGIVLFGNGDRPTPFGAPVVGSKTVVPVPLKLPWRIAAVGTVRCAVTARRRVVRSQSAKKKSLCFTIGPPIAPPNWFCRSLGARSGSPVQEYRQ